jgi:hypothetical protein
MKLFEHFKDEPSALENFGLKDALIWAGIIKPKEAMACVDGYNRIDLGGDPGQMKFDFEELFELPPAANQTLKRYRTVGSLVTEIVVVRRTDDGGLVSKCFNTFHEDIPQNPLLRLAYKTMSQKTQAAIEDYLAALEREERK